MWSSWAKIDELFQSKRFGYFPNILNEPWSDCTGPTCAPFYLWKNLNVPLKESQFWLFSRLRIRQNPPAQVLEFSCVELVKGNEKSVHDWRSELEGRAVFFLWGGEAVFLKLLFLCVLCVYAEVSDGSLLITLNMPGLEPFHHIQLSGQECNPIWFLFFGVGGWFTRKS